MVSTASLRHVINREKATITGRVSFACVENAFIEWLGRTSDQPNP
jgi:hypothetical protein